MKKYLIIAMILLVGSPVILKAQDIILKKNNEVIHCKIKEIGLDEVKYNLPDYPADLTFSLDKDRISKLIFENGTEIEVVREISNPANYEDNKKNALKIDFMSPLTGNTTFSYERSLGSRRSIEGSLGIIGLGLNVNDENAGGTFVKFGYKFIKDPDFYLRGMRYAHILKGSYVKPELAFGVYGRSYNDYMNYGGYYDQWGNWIYTPPVKKKETVVSATIQVVIGKQWIFDNTFLLDMYGGVGYGFTNKSTQYDGGYHFGYTMGSSEFPVAASAGIRLGFLFK